MLQMQIAKELGYTLSELVSKITLEEMLLWNTFFAIEKEEASKLAKRKR